MSDKMSDELLPCPFCGIDGMYEIIINNDLGDTEPALFCNACKMTFQVENDSPYMNADETYKYLKEKLHKTFNTRKPMERIVERLENYRDYFMDVVYDELIDDSDNCRANRIIDRFDDAIEIVKEEGEL